MRWGQQHTITTTKNEPRRERDTEKRRERRKIQLNRRKNSVVTQHDPISLISKVDDAMVWYRKADRINTFLFYFTPLSVSLSFCFFLFWSFYINNVFSRIFTNIFFIQHLHHHTSLCIGLIISLPSGTTLFAINCVRSVCVIRIHFTVFTWALQFYACIECHTLPRKRYILTSVKMIGFEEWRKKGFISRWKRKSRKTEKKTTRWLSYTYALWICSYFFLSILREWEMRWLDHNG